MLNAGPSPSSSAPETGEIHGNSAHDQQGPESHHSRLGTAPQLGERWEPFHLVLWHRNSSGTNSWGLQVKRNQLHLHEISMTNSIKIHGFFSFIDDSLQYKMPIFSWPSLIPLASRPQGQAAANSSSWQLQNGFQLLGLFSEYPRFAPMKMVVLPMIFCCTSTFLF